MTGMSETFKLAPIAIAWACHAFGLIERVIGQPGQRLRGHYSEFAALSGE